MYASNDWHLISKAIGRGATEELMPAAEDQLICHDIGADFQRLPFLFLNTQSNKCAFAYFSNRV